MSIEKLKDIHITNDDIGWIASLLGNNIEFDDSRKVVIKSLESVDIQAFPGSGKTTTLVAKLAILAKKWPFPNAGICVLSHTNVAREEIEDRLGNTVEGKKILSYPHFVGTLHSFFDTFIGLPWLRSRGISIKIIDTDYVKLLRWKMLSPKTREYFIRNYKDEKLCGYYGAWGSINWTKQGKTREELLSVISNSQNNGFFTFDEMLLLAQKVLNKHPTIAVGIQERFPLLFIDEAQDTNSLLWDLIHKAFPNDGIKTVRQGFGDSNQAIYNYVNEDVQDSEFPRSNPLVLNESRRFDNRIAALANSVAISQEQMHGTNNIFSDRNIPHTIYLFPKENASCVIDEFGKLILNTFSDEELTSNAKLGCHVIGMVHKKNDDTPEKHFPKGIYDYWPNHNPLKKSKNQIQKCFIDYFRIGISEFSCSGDMSCLVNWIAKGMCRVINRAAKTSFVMPTNNTFVTIEKMLPDEKHLIYRQLMLDLALSKFRTKEEWNSVINKVDNILKLFDLSLISRDRVLLNWVDEVSFEYDDKKAQSKVNNYFYQDSVTGRSVYLEFGSIHSVKGRTHLATMVLETFSSAHNIKSILNYLCGKPPKKTTKSNIGRLKCQYVAMSRATALLCLAIPKEFVDADTQKLLADNGWTINVLT